jgi:pimeloyl-ACP methyl ester carboxylesterase
MQAHWVEASAGCFFVYEWGDPGGSAVLFWDGQGGSGLHANEMAPILADDYGLRVIAPDAPGHGRSPALPLEAYRPSMLAMVAADLLSALGVSRAAFVGFSWGAEIGCAFAARFPQRTTQLVLIDGGYWDFADLPSFDTSADLETRVAVARERASKTWYPSWDAYFAAESAALRRWTPALEGAHRATMREEDGRIIPILSGEVVGAIHYGNCVEPTSSTYAALRVAHVPILLLTPSELRPEGVARDGVSRFQRNVPQLRVQRMPGDVHDLVSYAAPEVAVIVGDWLRQTTGAGDLEKP